MLESEEERWRHCRARIHLRCELVTPGPARRLVRRTVGITEDITRSALMIRWRKAHKVSLPGVGDALVLALQLPAQHPNAPRFLYCCGRVVRILMCNRVVLVAVEVMQMRFWSPKTRVRQPRALSTGA